MTEDEAQASPLSEPSPVDLFSLAPEQVSDAMHMRQIAIFREERHAWNKLEKTKADKKGAPKPAKGSVVVASLSDLGL